MHSKVELGADQKVQLVNVGTQNVRAYDVFLLGLHEAHWSTRQSFEQAINHFQLAAQLDPGFGRVYWWLHLCYSRLMGVGLPPEEMAPKAEEALKRAEAAGFVPPIPWVQARRDLYPETRPAQRALAIEACKKIRQPDPEWQSWEYLQLGDCLVAAGLFHAALDYTERYLESAQHDLSDTMNLQTYRHLLTRLGRYDKAIDLWTELIAARPDDPIAVGERALLYSRTGQYEKAEQDLTELRKVFPRSFPELYHMYWRRDVDAAKAYFTWLEGRKNLQPLYKYWGCFLLADVEGGISYVEEEISRGVSAILPVNPAQVRLQVTRPLPQSISREVEQHPRFQAILKQFGLDDTWRDELMAMANELTDVTGIHVQLDDAR
ncbi:MAG: tetratricopeptide repeat protein [Pseudomonadales bacterium]|jgi:hypothetical protein|nr:tetratricopeptide repeat protein [Pseudomonadales bacterium]MDP7359608.1 tetratricopeptide repeat protein [Pseudomonadales bacterium]MDP7596038.1 tetratricopeptide repeat protein [Pseudomonadales bacterium]HJN51350.1 tetratricopeptide repeat protein [Pseudomonadales bacterium]|tara:strand:- start:6240 stop:7370 length:1131 start_codon:yes stop_codon:yes gene_type:complete